MYIRKIMKKTSISVVSLGRFAQMLACWCFSILYFPSVMAPFDGAFVFIFLCLVLESFAIKHLQASEFDRVVMDPKVDVLVQFHMPSSEACGKFAEIYADLEAISKEDSSALQVLLASSPPPPPLLCTHRIFRLCSLYSHLNMVVFRSYFSTVPLYLRCMFANRLQQCSCVD